MTSAKVRTVGFDMQESGDDNRMIVEAIEQDNPGATVEYIPGLIRTRAPGELRIRRETVEEKLGRAWETHEFQLSIVTYAGHIACWDDDEIVVKWDH